ncbi:MAG TPA: FGGY-family carbohydrate kinase [Polyangiaceae bacterium]|nr:FGGY-family carbohydrate kinase [Polyangiaceae bacterium]
MATRYVLAWDLGTSGAKAGIVTPEGDVLGSEFEPVELLLSPGGGAEQRPDDWWRALRAATERLLARDLAPRAAIAAIGVTSQWSGTVALDSAGKPLMNAMIWMDSRGSVPVRRLSGGFPAVAGYALPKLWRWVRLTGGAPGHSGKDPVAHIAWLRQNRPDLYSRVHKFLEPKDYLTFLLTGRITATFDSIALHWVTDNRDPAHIHYEDSLLRLAGLERSQLPELVAAPSIIGPILPEHAEHFSLSPEVVVTGSTPDVHSAAIGAGTTQNFATHLYIGTSAWLACHVPKKKTDIAHNMASLPSAIPGRYLLVSEQETAGACLTHVRDKLLFASDDLSLGAAPADYFQAFDRVAQRAPAGSRKLLFLPWLYGERAPVEDRALRGALFNYSLEHERSDLARSVLEGVAFNLRWLFQHVQGFIGQSISELRFIGGGADSALWSQILADVLGCRLLKLHAPRLSNLRGAAFIAFVALGELDFDAIPGRVRVEQTFEPNLRHQKLYQELFGEFQELLRRNRPVFHRLNPSGLEAPTGAK